MFVDYLDLLENHTNNILSKLSVMPYDYEVEVVDNESQT